MENEIKWKIHDFEGKGQITTTYKTTLSCYFRVYIRQDGKSKLECWIYLTNENIEKVIEIFRRSSINTVKGLFEGTDNNKGKIKIKKIYLDILKSRSDTTIGMQNPEKYFIKKELIDKFFQIHLYYKYRINDYNSSQYLNQVFITEFTFGITSNIDIQYDSIIDNKEITARWNLVNFMMGTPDSTVDFPKEINIKVKNHSIKFVPIENYNNIISQSSINKNADVTSYAEIVTTVKDIKNIEKIFKDTCILISLANCNWITPFSKSIYQDGRLIMMTFYKITPYPFNKSRYLIKNENLDKFILKSFHPYRKLLKDFRLHKVIEYYISAITNSIAQERFLIGYVALECLCNNISEFAKKNGKVIIPQAIEETKTRLRKAFKKLKINVTENDIEKITDKVAYKAITIKDAQRYMFDYYNVEYTKYLINSLYEIRNRLMHGKDFDAEYNILFEGINRLFSLIDRTILMMLDWKDEKYQNKTNRGYKETQLKK